MLFGEYTARTWAAHDRDNSTRPGACLNGLSTLRRSRAKINRLWPKRCKSWDTCLPKRYERIADATPKLPIPPANGTFTMETGA